MPDYAKIAPEIDLLILSFPMHFTWEFLQAPLFVNMQAAAHIDGIRTCLQTTIGDMGIVLATFWLVSLHARSRNWVSTRIGDLRVCLSDLGSPPQSGSNFRALATSLAGHMNQSCRACP